MIPEQPPRWMIRTRTPMASDSSEISTGRARQTVTTGSAVEIPSVRRRRRVCGGRPETVTDNHDGRACDTGVSTPSSALSEHCRGMHAPEPFVIARVPRKVQTAHSGPVASKYRDRRVVQAGWSAGRFRLRSRALVLPLGWCSRAAAPFRPRRVLRRCAVSRSFSTGQGTCRLGAGRCRLRRRTRSGSAASDAGFQRAASVLR